MRAKIEKLKLETLWENPLKKFFEEVDRLDIQVNQCIKKYPQYKLENFHSRYFITDGKNDFVLTADDEIKEIYNNMSFHLIERGKYWNLFMVLWGEDYENKNQ